MKNCRGDGGIGGVQTCGWVNMPRCWGVQCSGCVNGSVGNGGRVGDSDAVGCGGMGGS